MINRKIKLAIIMPYLSCGGVESTLLSLLNVLDRKKYDIDLLLLERKGSFLSRLPEDIKIKEITIPNKEKGVFFGKKKQIKKYLLRGEFVRAFCATVHNVQYTISENRQKNVEYFDFVEKSIPEDSDIYDVAIDYFGYATFTTFYLAEKINAKLKISWLHSILSRFHPEAFIKYYEKIDMFFAVSEMVKADFLAMFSTIHNVKVFHNVIDIELIKRKALETGGFSDNYSGVRILTVGRITHEKGSDLAYETMKKLVDEGYAIRWYMIGEGEDREKISLQLKGTKYEEHFCFLGLQQNPFPYMRQCDIYVQPSRFEGYCTTTNEARILGCAVITTDVSGAREQFKDGVTGLIVQIDIDEIYNAVKKMINNPQFRKMLKENLRDTYSYDQKEHYEFERLISSHVYQ